MCRDRKFSNSDCVGMFNVIADFVIVALFVRQPFQWCLAALFRSLSLDLAVRALAYQVGSHSLIRTPSKSLVTGTEPVVPSRSLSVSSGVALPHCATPDLWIRALARVAARNKLMTTESSLTTHWALYHAT
jgi:hypothetical protein